METIPIPTSGFICRGGCPNTYSKKEPFDAYICEDTKRNIGGGCIRINLGGIQINQYLSSLFYQLPRPLTGDIEAIGWPLPRPKETLASVKTCSSVCLGKGRRYETLPSADRAYRYRRSSLNYTFILLAGVGKYRIKYRI